VVTWRGRQDYPGCVGEPVLLLLVTALALSEKLNLARAVKAESWRSSRPSLWRRAKFKVFLVLLLFILGFRCPSKYAS
jgi:hypothetical protein